MLAVPACTSAPGLVVHAYVQVWRRMVSWPCTWPQCTSVPVRRRNAQLLPPRLAAAWRWTAAAMAGHPTGESAGPPC